MPTPAPAPRPVPDSTPASRPSAARPLGTPARHHASVGSTMTEAAAWAAAGAPHGAVVVAETQTAGRGRHGRTWQDVPGASLMLSVVLRPRLAPERLGLVGLAAGLALAETAEAFGASAVVKWPNDVLAAGPDGRLAKLAGVLAEASWSGTAARRRPRCRPERASRRPSPRACRATSLRIATGRDRRPARRRSPRSSTPSPGTSTRPSGRPTGLLARCRGAPRRRGRAVHGPAFRARSGRP